MIVSSDPGGMIEVLIQVPISNTANAERMRQRIIDLTEALEEEQAMIAAALGEP